MSDKNNSNGSSEVSLITLFLIISFIFAIVVMFLGDSFPLRNLIAGVVGTGILFAAFYSLTKTENVLLQLLIFVLSIIILRILYNTLDLQY